jgi:hypothetical protein
MSADRQLPTTDARKDARPDDVCKEPVTPSAKQAGLKDRAASDTMEGYSLDILDQFFDS